MSNWKAQQFAAKRAAPKAAASEGLDPSALQQILMPFIQKIFQLEQNQKRIESLTLRANSVAKVADYRSLAIMELLAAQGISSEQIISKILELQVKDFEAGSAQDDKDRNLSDAAPDAEAQEGNLAITSVKLFKDGQELKDEFIVRSKTVIGKAELFAELDGVLLGMKAGETRRFPLNLQNKTDEAEVTLLGLKLAPVAVQEAPPAADEAQEDGESGSQQ